MRLALLFCLPLLAQDAPRRFENHPDGALRAEYEVRVEPDGSEVRDGSYKSWYEDGQVESEGRYVDGARGGEWSFWWPGGERKATGSYRDGERDGAWRLYDENGKRQARGEYDAGHRTGSWTFWDAKGKVDETRSGTYAWKRVPLGGVDPASHEPVERALVLEGELRDGIRSGLWRLLRPDGTTILAGHFSGAGASGPWVLVHADGTIDPDWMSGRYLLGVRLGPLQELPEDFEPPEESREPDPRRAPPLAAPEAARAAVDAWLAAGAGARESATRPLLDDPQAAFEAAVAKLQTLDLSTPEGDATGRRLNDELLRAIVGVAFPWQPLAEEGAARANALTALRWRAVRELVDPGDPAWRRQLDPQWRWTDAALEWTVVGRGPEIPELARGGLALGPRPGGRFGGRLGGSVDKAIAAQGGRGTPEAVDAALGWLERTQDASGCWEKGTVRTVEASSFALLALQGRGATPLGGEHSECLARGLRWAVSCLRGDGRIATDIAADLRSHALALQAVAEGAYQSGLPALLETTRRARDYLLAQQLEDGSWPRDPGGAQGDTLTTAYALFALTTVQETPVRCEAEPRERARAWLDAQTGPDGSTAPCDEGRAPVTTAWTALCRLFAGRDPVDDAALAAQVGWLIAHPSSIDPGDPLLDPEYVCLAAHVLFQVGGKPWDTWNETMKIQLLQVQKRQGDAAGSWDATGVGPYDRTTATALRALTFEVYTRFSKLARKR